MVLKRILMIWLLALLQFTGCTLEDESTEITAVSPEKNNSTTPQAATQVSSPTSTQAMATRFPIIPTLPSDRAYETLFGMLNDKSMCLLPCWLNITPGISSHNDAFSAWGSFLKIAQTTEAVPKDYLYLFDHTAQNDRISISTQYSLNSQSEVIALIHVTSQLLRSSGNESYQQIYDSVVYQDLLRPYLLPSILSTYGLPDQIMLSMEIIEAEPTSPDYFYVWLLYPSRGFIVQYKGAASVNNGIVTGCPSDSFVTLWLAPPQNSNLYQDALNQAMELPSSPFYKSTEEAIGMTAAEFYREFQKPSNTCINSPLNIWPER